MSGELISVWGTEKTLVSSGASIASGAMGLPSAASYGVVADGASFPDADFVLAVTFGTAPLADSTLDLYAAELDIDGSNDAPLPSSTYRRRYVGSFPLSATTFTQYVKLSAYDVARLANYFLYNPSSGQAVTAGWTLKVTPRTIKPAP